MRTVEVRKVASIHPVIESLVDDEQHWQRMLLPSLKRQGLNVMSQLGTVIEGTLEHEVLRQVEINGLRPAFWDEDVYGIPVPGDYAMVRFKALAVPHGSEVLDVG